MNSLQSVGIISIATNNYFEYWTNMLKSFSKVVKDTEGITFYLFTDSPIKAMSVADDYQQYKFKIFTIPSYVFPEASLFRYEFIQNESSQITSDLLIYLDADMLIVKDFIFELSKIIPSNQMVLVAHPGYWRPKNFSLLKFYLSQPRYFLKDMFRKFRLGGIGAWETRKTSSAFTPRRKRLHYVCGGIWLGQREIFLKTIEELFYQVQKDQLNEVLAIWHDESHLNSWASQNSYFMLGPEFCYEASYPQLDGLRELVRAVNKNAA